jgi:broad specificity phosphatase PhoE
MPPTTVLLARHGESDWNVEGRFQGHVDRPLTEVGRRQAAALADQLAKAELDAVYTSDLRRAWETAAPVAERHGLPLHRLRALREVDVGSWAGLTRDEVAARFPVAYRRWLDGGAGWDDGESYERMGARVVAGVADLATRHPGGRILIVSHGGVVRALHAAALDVDMATLRLRRRVSANAELTAILVEHGRLSPAPELALD